MSLVVDAVTGSLTSGSSGHIYAALGHICLPLLTHTGHFFVGAVLGAGAPLSLFPDTSEHSKGALVGSGRVTTCWLLSQHCVWYFGGVVVVVVVVRVKCDSIQGHMGRRGSRQPSCDKHVLSTWLCCLSFQLPSL